MLARPLLRAVQSALVVASLSASAALDATEREALWRELLSLNGVDGSCA